MACALASDISPRGGPYPPTTAGLGGVPTVTPDIPIDVVFMVIYLSFALTNFNLFRLNQQRKHKFVISALLGGFSMARVTTLVLRIAWATRQRNLRLAIASQVFVNAGVLMMYVINVILAQRILRAQQPHIGWNPILRAAYKLVYITLGIALAMVIVTLVISLYTRSPHTKYICRSIQLAALAYLLIFTLLPFPHSLLAIRPPRAEDAESFGEGSLKSKMVIVTASALLCTLISGFKAGVNWSSPRPLREPAWFDSKACFYVFNFSCEVCVLALLTFSRIDKRFWIPDGCNGVGDYTRLRRREPGVTESEEEGK